MTTGIWIGLFLGLGVYVVVVYNRFIQQRNQMSNALAQIDVQLKRRYDLVPNLVEVARKYMQHERDTLEAVTRARQQASAAASRLQGTAAGGTTGGDVGAGASWMAADAALSGALGRLMMVAEAYPELKADQTMRELSEELNSTENRIGYARQSYNDVVLRFNNSVEQFPANVVAKLFSFKAAEMLQSTESAEERRAPRVQF